MFMKFRSSAQLPIMVAQPAL